MLNLKSTLLVLILLIVGAGFFLTKIQVSNTPSTYIPKNLPSKILNDELLEEFNNEDSIVILFQSSTPLDRLLIKKLASFTEELESFESIKKIRSIFNYESLRSINDGFQVTNIIDRNKLEKLLEQDISKKVQADRFVKDLFITKDLKTFGILVETEYIHHSMLRMKLDKKLHDSITKNELDKNLIAYGGEFSVDTAQFKELDKIMFVIVPITFLIGVLLLYFLFNSIIAVFVGTAFNGVVAFVVLSLFGAFGWPYNLIGSMIPTLMMALCIAFIVHLYNGILLRKEGGEGHEESIKNSVDSIKKPSFYSALTTSAGLLSLSISDIPPIRSVGVIGGIGVMIIYLMVIYLIPPILIALNYGTWKQNNYFKIVLDTIVNKLLSISLKYHKLVIVSLIGSMSILSLFIFNVESESNIYKFFNSEHNVNISSRLIKENFVGTTTVNLVFDKGEDDVISSKFNQKIDVLKTSLLTVPNVGRVFSATDIIKQLNWAFQGESPKNFMVPRSDELISQYLFIYDGEDIYDFLSRDQERFKMTLNLNVEGANEIEKTLKSIEDKIREVDFSKYKWAISGYGKMFSDQENLIMNDLFKSVGISFIVIFTLMSFLWRSISGSLFCMLPNISPVIAMFIFMGVFGIWLDIGTAMIASVTVGIAVDDTIHIFEGFMRRKELMSVDDALRKTYKESGRAIIITSFILSAQFLILMFIDFVPLRNFGLLTTIGIVTALVFDLLLLPAMIILKYRPKVLKS
jgi:predicted RND superfamily exporter protein